MKMKRRFNWFDGLIILAIVIVAFGVVSRMTGQVQVATATGSKFFYTIEVKKVRQATVDAIGKSVGKKFNMNDKARTDDMGILLRYEVRPSTLEVEKANGEAVLAEISERFDVTLYFELEGQVNAVGYFTPQLSNIGAGSVVVIRSKFVQVRGSIQGVKSEKWRKKFALGSEDEGICWQA